jgi:hypothetical protein
MKRLFSIAWLVMAAAVSGVAADVAGNWKATADGPQGKMERTFAFKVDGEKLSGETVSSFVGKSEIRDGSVKGDDVSFVITISIQGNEMDVQYKGKLVGADEIKFVSTAGDNEFEWLATRQ